MRRRDPRVAVLAPSPILTVTLEREDGEPELHLHAGGQGFWAARMLRELGIVVAFCAPLGGEVGTVLRALLAAAGLDLRPVETSGWNGAYVHDRRGEGVTVVGGTESPRLTRHETDALYTATIAAGLDADLAVLTGPRDDELLEPDFYRRISHDLRSNGVEVVADLSDPALAAALSGGLDLVHVSERELREHDASQLRDLDEIVAATRRLAAEGAGTVIVSRGPAPALALIDDAVVELVGPVFDAREERGAGDSMFAAAAASLARGSSTEDALKLGVAAGALNVVRRGLGSGSRADIERLAGTVELRPLGDR